MDERPASAILSEPAPSVGTVWAAGVLLETYGLRAELTDLRSERDRNFLATADTGRQVVLKVSHSAENPSVVAMENAAMDHVAQVDPTLAIPRLVRTRDGSATVPVKAGDGRSHVVRVVTVLPGVAADCLDVPRGFADDLGRWSARLATALRGFFHPAGGRAIEWDPRRVHELQPYVERLDPSRRDLVAGVLERVVGIGERTASLPAGLLHADVTMSNVLVQDGAITGLIDFGDMHHTARVCDLAITITSLLRVVAATGGDSWQASARVLQGYQRTIPLDTSETELIGELVLARLAATVLISAWRAPENPDNHEYLTGLDAGSWLLLDQLTEFAPEALASRFMGLCGTSRVRSGQRPDPSLIDRRRTVLGGDVAPLFYQEPLHIVRGDGPWLIAADGRRYLDAYNNVAVIGHEHPAVVSAIVGQARVLNTHSRYLHQNIVELAERIVATMPEELDTCLFVNSGSEATDLAWRLAVTSTAATGGIVTNCSYHGVSAATSPLSSNTWPNGYQPDHVAVFEPPHVRPDGSAPDHREARQRVDAAVAELALQGHRPALLAIDPMFTSAGVLTPSAGFIAGLVDAIHAAGGLFLADEVQAGFGRGGHALWRFLDFGVVPDLVALGKPMGNGHPIAAVVTRRAIVDRLSAKDEFFSTFAGNPVSSAAGLAVLDVIDQEGLTARACDVGDYLRGGVAILADTHSALGEVRGQGLIAGIDIHDAQGEDRSLTLAVVNRLRDLGVLVGSTGRRGNALKVRPPLIWEREHADVFLEALDQALTDLGRSSGRRGDLNP